LTIVLDNDSDEGADSAGEMYSWEQGNRVPLGRRTLSNGILLGHRDRLVSFLSLTWPEVGWRLLSAHTAEKVQEAFSVFRGNEREYLIKRFFDSSSAAACTTKDLRRLAKDIEVATAEVSRYHNKKDQSERAFNEAEIAMKMAGLLKTEDENQQNVPTLSEEGTNLDEREQQLLRAEYEKRRSDLNLATIVENQAQTKEASLRGELESKENFFAQAELAEFISVGKYARNPLQLANAMAGLPQMRWERSYARCSKLPCTGWPTFDFSIFDTIERIWKLRHDCPGLSIVELFRNEIEKLPRTVEYVAQQTVQNGEIMEEKKSRMPNNVRSYLADFRYLRLAIEEALKSNQLPYRVPFLIASNLNRNHKTMTTAVHLVLAAPERID
jgi:hypothetical protein